jgi:hypothetical protein
MSRRLMYRLIYIPCLIGVAALIGLFGHLARSQGAVKAAGMTTYVAEDKSFSIGYPRTWGASASTMNGTGVRAHLRQSEHAEVIVTSDLAGSILADMSRSGVNMGASLPGMSGSGSTPGAETALPNLSGMGGAAQQTPLQAAHAFGAGYIRSKFAHYEEQPPEKSEMAGGAALTSAFTAQTSALLNPEEIVGRHVTILSGNRPVTIDAYCPKDEAKEFFTTFENMLQTLRVSETGG